MIHSCYKSLSISERKLNGRVPWSTLKPDSIVPDTIVIQHEANVFFIFFFSTYQLFFQFLSSIQRYYQTIDTTSIICINFLLQKLETFLSGYCATVNLYMVTTTPHFTTIAMEKKTPCLL